MRRIDRRTYLSLTVGTAVAIAGCTSDGDEPMDGTENDEPETSAEADDDSASRDDAGLEEADEATESDDSNTDLEVGELLEIDDLQLLVSDLDRADDVVEDSNGEDIEGDEDATVAVVDFSLKYVGDEAVRDVDELVTVELRDGDGETYERFTALETEPVDLTESRLAPGEVARGDLVYDIDDDIEGLELEIESVADSEVYVVDLETEADSIPTLEQELSDDVLRFGQRVESEGIEVTVTTLEQGNNLGGFMQSDEGSEIVAVEVLIENGSGRNRTLSPEQVQLKDEFGRSHDEAPGVLRALEGFDENELEDGEEHDGKIAYELEEGLSELYWVFDFTEWGDDQRVFWQLR